MIDREKLKEKYGDEEVLVVPLKVIQRLGLDDGGYLDLRSHSDIDVTAVFEELYKNSYYIPRWKSDENPEEVEIISYITFEDKSENIFAYKRIKNGDNRGDGAYSIGVGGHINPCDGYNAIITSAEREVQEEVGLSPQEYSMSLKGVIRCKDNAFNLDHIGLHFVAYSKPINKVNEVDKMLPLGMLTTQALAFEFYDNLENWSKLIVDYKFL